MSRRLSPSRRSSSVLGVLALLCALGLSSGALAAPEHAPGAAPAGASAIADRIIVEWRADATSADRALGRDAADTDLVHTLGRTSFQLVQPQAGQTASDALSALRSDPAVQTATRDGYSTLDSIPNDPLFGQLWGLQNLGLGIDGFVGAVAGDDVDAPAAWDRTTGTPATVIADLDTGYRFTDGDLGPVPWTNAGEIPGNNVDDDGNGYRDDVHGYDFVGASADSPTSDNDPTDDNIFSGGHGLHTAGTMGAAGNNGVGITGVAQNVRIMPLRVCADSAANNHQALCPTSSQIAAINYAGAMGARAANMSLGGTSFNTAVLDAIASNPRTLYVISAGNDAQNNDPGGTPHYPCAYDPTTSGIPGAIDNVICVAATDQADQLASFSDWGARSVDLGAPGTETLSTYLSTASVYHDDFETNDFATRWTIGGDGFGRAGVGDGPLTSFGMTDSPGAAPVANSVHTATLTTSVSVPAGDGSCTFGGWRFLSKGTGGTFTYSILIDGSPVPSLNGITPADTAGSSMVPFGTIPFTGAAGHNVNVSFTYAAGSSPTAANGVWLDDLDLTCYQPTTASLTYEFLQGTSMAAPHVTGAAGLLFSLKPSATVTEVKNALLSGVDPDPSLLGITTTGGRLDVAAAMGRLVPPDTAIGSGPSGSTTSTAASFAFGRSDSPGAAATFDCQLDGAAFSPCTSPASYTVGLGAHSFAVRARDLYGDVDPTPATAAWTVVAPPSDGGSGSSGGGGGGSSGGGDSSGGGGGTTARPIVVCRVPKLAGLSLARAKAKLRAAHCKLGKVTKPRAKRGHKLPALVVTASKPKAGTRAAAGAKVALTLGPKPRPKHKRR